MDKLLGAVHIESFRNNKFVNKNKELPPGLYRHYKYLGRVRERESESERK